MKRRIVALLTCLCMMLLIIQLPVWAESTDEPGGNTPTESTSASEPTEETTASEPTEETTASEPTETTGAVQYTITFLNWDGTEISSKTYYLGDTVEIPENPTREADETYSYTFAGWDPEVVTTCQGDAVYTATYTSAEIEPEEYTVVFKNWDGTEISSKTYHLGDTVEIPEDPTREADETYTYTFAGWDPEVVTTCQGDAVYTATFTSVEIKPEEYTVVFKNWDGSEISSKTYHLGDTVEVPENPTREADETYTYTFAGWDPEVVTTCQGDAVYTATYTSTEIEPEEYTVVFKNWDGTEISSKTYHLGDTVEIPENPTREADESYTYTFAGWDPEVVTTCQGDAVYTATFTSVEIEPEEYTVVFKNWDGTEISSKTYHLGDTVEIPEDPTREADGVYFYTFVGWDQTVTECLGDAVYTAVFEKTAIEVTSIAITVQPSKLIYTQGEQLNTAGMEVTAYYNDGTSAVVTDYTVSGYDANVIGPQTVTVSYNGLTAVFTVEVEPASSNHITTDVYTISDGYISKITAGTTVAQFMSGINESEVQVFKGGSAVSGTTKIGTGMVIQLILDGSVKDELTVVVTGDTNGDGSITVTDMLAIKSHVLKKTALTGAAAKAADTSGDKSISITDFIQVKSQILGKSKIQAVSIQMVSSQALAENAQLTVTVAEQNGVMMNRAVYMANRSCQTNAWLKEKERIV